MSSDNDTEMAPPQTRSSVPNYPYSDATEAMNSINRQVQTFHEKYMELGVRAHLLEVDLATLFSPDMVLALDRLEETCQACKEAVEELAQDGDQNPSDEPADVDNNIQDYSSEDNVTCPAKPKAVVDVDDEQREKEGSC